MRQLATLITAGIIYVSILIDCVVVIGFWNYVMVPLFGFPPLELLMACCVTVVFLTWTHIKSEFYKTLALVVQPKIRSLSDKIARNKRS